MKKQTKLLLTFITVFCIGLNSCSKDDDSEEHKENTLGKRLVEKLVCTSNDGKFTFSFFYDKEGKLEKVIGDNPEILKEVTYSKIGDKLVVQADYGEEGKKTTSFTLNDVGNVISYSNTITYKYQNDFLDKAYFSNQYSDSFLWKNGNITECKSIYSNSTNNKTCTYYQQENKMNIDPFDFTWIVESLAFDEGILCFSSGYFGKRNTHLLKKVEAPNWSYEFSYSYDDEGYVSQFVCDYKEAMDTAYPEHAVVTYTVVYSK